MEKFVLRQNHRENLKLFVYNLNESPIQVFNSQEISSNEAPDFKYFEFPTSHIFEGNVLYLGLNTGHVLKIDSRTGKLLERKDAFDCDNLFYVWDRHYNKDTYEKNIEDAKKFLEFKKKQGIPLNEPNLSHRIQNVKHLFRLGIEGIVNGIRNINTLTICDKQVYCATSAGVFNFDKSQYEREGFMHSLALYKEQLHFVSMGPGLFEVISSNCSQNQDQKKALINFKTGKILLEDLVLTDGSGCKPANYIIEDDTAYIHHGNWPGERITRRNISTNKQTGSIRIPTSDKFLEHHGEVFDIRSHHDLRYIILSDQEDFYNYSHFILDSNSSATSALRTGILIASYNPEKNKTEILSLLGKNKTEIIDSFEGKYSFL